MDKYGSFKRDFDAADFDGQMALELVKYVGMLNRCMDRAIKDGTPYDSVVTFLRELGEGLNADRTYIFQVNANDRFDNTFEWCAEVVEKEINELQDLPFDFYSIHWVSAFAEKEGYYITDMEAYRELDPEMYAILKPQKIDQLAICPFFFEGRMVGAIGVDNPGADSFELCLPILQLSSSYMASLLRHSLFVEKGAQIDPLTGLMSLANFRDQLMEQKNKHQEQLDVVYIDVTNFKVFNREHGFGAGDELLRTLSRVIQTIAGTHYAARAVADHFYVLVPDDKAEAIIKAVHDEMINDERFAVSIRAGIYALDSDDELFTPAVDRARMAANNTVGDYQNYYLRYNSKMEVDLMRTNYLLSHIDEAVKKGWIKVFYQPIVDTFSQKISTFEALARWIDPAYGFMNPAEFIDVLEQGHLIHKLDLFILEQVCRDLRDAAAAGRPHPAVSVNLSRYDLEMPGLHDKINGLLAKYGVDRDEIRIEITESALLNNGADLIKEHIRRFHEDGYQVWLDDFGSGFSSLNSLQNFDFDLLKIDMDFLRHANEKTPIILMDVIDMAKRLNIETLAEGVEEKEEYDFLHELGCVLTQGYYFSKPRPKEELAQVIAEKQLEYETPDEHFFYRKIGKVNVLNASYPFSEENERPSSQTLPVTILLVKDDVYQTIYANKTSKDGVKYLGVATMAEANLLINDPSKPFFSQIQTLLHRADQIKGVAESNFVAPHYLGKMKAQLIAVNGDTRAYLVSCQDYTLGNGGL